MSRLCSPTSTAGFTTGGQRLEIGIYGMVYNFSISISMSRGNLSDRKFVIDEEKIPIIREKAVKSR